MCYTIEIYLSRKAIEERFNVDSSVLDDFDFRYFYSAFSNPILPVVTQKNPEKVELMQWGLIPHWTKDIKQARQIRSGTYNARSESIHEKASFKAPFASQRCWVIANGFFEWQMHNKQKIPWYIKLNNNTPFVFAGLYDSWADPESGEIHNTFTVITTKANPLLEKIHNTRKRMPVILNKATEDIWINPKLNQNDVKELMLPFPEKEMKAYPVSRDLIKKNSDPRNSSIIGEVDLPVSGSLFD